MYPHAPQKGVGVGDGNGASAGAQEGQNAPNQELLNLVGLLKQELVRKEQTTNDLETQKDALSSTLQKGRYSSNTPFTKVQFSAPCESLRRDQLERATAHLADSLCVASLFISCSWARALPSLVSVFQILHPSQPC